MKRNRYFFTIIFSLLTGFAGIAESKAQSTPVADTVVMGTGYANEIYYNLTSGSVLSSLRNSWDIAFRTSVMSSSIITNDGTGVVLYTYPLADTSGWASVDTTGLFGWTAMYNDPTDWENGAFSRNATGHPDYGWGIYNSVTHNLAGDSLFVIKLRDGSFRKLWIEEKRSAAATYIFRYAMLDGSDLQEITLDLSGDAAFDFMGFSMITNQKVQFEAPKEEWDIVFTKYMSVQPNGTPYGVTGVLSNDKVKVKNFHPVPLSYNDWGVGTWDSTRSAIGWNWKVFDNTAFKIVDSSVYFVKTRIGDIHKIYFTYFQGSSTGKIGLVREKVAGVGIGETPGSALSVSVYPNPVRNTINLVITGLAGENISFVLTDLSGRQLRADRSSRLTDGVNTHSIDVTGVQPGIYFVVASAAATKVITKVIIAG